jgi:hypothetical protein
MSEINNNKEDLFAFLSEDKQEVDLSFAEEVLEEVVADLDQDEEVLDEKEEVVTLPEPKTEKTVVEAVEDNVVGTSVKTPKAAKPKSKSVEVPGRKDKVAIHSSKNVTWSSVGTVYIGYNIVTPEAAEKWLERKHIRMATPEEVAKEFGL